MTRRQKPLGLRREVLVFLPTALLLLVVIAGFNLYIYGNSVRELELARTTEARRLAAHAAAGLAQEGGSPTSIRLERLAPSAGAVALFDADGQLIAQSATSIWVAMGTLFPDGPPSEPHAIGPTDLSAPVVTAVAPFEIRGRPFFLQLDLPADRLAAQIDVLERTLYVNIVALGSVALLVLLFMRRLLQPFESLLERARSLDADRDPTGDEVDFLLDTFERAVQALEDRQDGATDDIAVLERALAPSLESGLLLLDSSGVVLALNEIGADLLAVEAPVPGAYVGEVLGHQPELLEALTEAVWSGRSIQRREFRLETGPTHRIIGLTLNLLRRDDHAIRGFIVLFTDLTESRARAQEAQVARSLKQLGELAAGVAHELRNGLATLKGYLTLIEHQPGDETVRDYLGEMQTEAEHLERVVSDFLSFARPGTIALESIDLGEVALRASRDPSLGGATVELETSESVGDLRGDSLLLQRAVRNLLHNAAQAQAEAGSEEPIRVAVQPDADGVLLTIDDAGPGLSEALADSLFQPFVSGRAEGVGLGLALAQRITELHAGSLTLTNRPGGGARATLRLPVTIDTHRNS